MAVSERFPERAEMFSADADYAKGDLVNHNGSIWRFTKAHSGDWNEADVVRIVYSNYYAVKENAMLAGNARVAENVYIHSTEESAGFPLAFAVRIPAISVLPYIVKDSRITENHVILTDAVDKTFNVDWETEEGRLTLTGSVPEGETFGPMELALVYNEPVYSITYDYETGWTIKGLTVGQKYIARVYQETGGTQTALAAVNFTANATEKTWNPELGNADFVLELWDMERMLAAKATRFDEAIRQAVLAVTGVTVCRVYRNDSDSTDENGIPAKSVSVVFSGGNARSVATAIASRMPSGYGTYGALPVNVFVDGQTIEIRIQRTVSDLVSITVEISPLAGFDAENTPEAIRAAILAWAVKLDIAQPLVVPELLPVIYGADPSATPSFEITLASATLNGQSTAGTLASGWNRRFAFSAHRIQVFIVQ